LTSHIEWRVFLFAHTIRVVLYLIAFILVFAADPRGATASLRQADGRA
jgi:hypothetical protein